MRVNDAVIGILLVVFAALIFAYARTLPAIPGQEYGAAVFPMLVAFGLAGCGAVLLASGVRHWAGAVALDPWARAPRAWLRLGAVFGLVLLYVLAADAIGFVPISILILGVLCILAGARWWVAGAVALAATFVIHQTFAGMLRVPLPLGLLGP